MSEKNVQRLPAEELFSALGTEAVVFAEEVCAAGCLGERALAAASLAGRPLRARLLNLGGGVVGQGSAAELRAARGIDAAAIVKAVKELIYER